MYYLLPRQPKMAPGRLKIGSRRHKRPPTPPKGLQEIPPTGPREAHCVFGINALWICALSHFGPPQAHDGPRCTQVGLNTAHDGRKRAPRQPRGGPKEPKSDPTGPQIGPTGPSDGSQTPRHKTALKAPQDGLRKRPNCPSAPSDGPGGPQETPRHPQGAVQRPQEGPIGSQDAPATLARSEMSHVTASRAPSKSRHLNCCAGALAGHAAGSWIHVQGIYNQAGVHIHHAALFARAH